jgi:hypothetical protein
MSGFLRARFIALDSSHLGALARDAAATGAPRRQATAFLGALDAAGAILLFCHHHIQELLAHRDEAVRAGRIAFIRALPVVGWVQSIRDDGVGSIADLQAREVAQAFRRPHADLRAIRDETAKNVFAIGRGSALVSPFEQNWNLLAPEMARQEARQRELVAISRSNFANISHVKIVDLLKQGLRNSAEITARFAEFHNDLRRDIKERGDERIPDAGASSSLFLKGIMRWGMGVVDAQNPALRILQSLGFSLDDIGPETTVGDIGRMKAFRDRLAVLNRSLDLPWPALVKCVTEERLPSAQVAALLENHRADTKRWKGSDLTDRYLACLACYADLTLVDKRILEAFRKIRQHEPLLVSLLCPVARASEYADVLQHLGSTRAAS